MAPAAARKQRRQAEPRGRVASLGSGSSCAADVQQRGPSLGALGRWPRGAGGAGYAAPGVGRWGGPRATPPLAPPSSGRAPGSRGLRGAGLPGARRGLGRSTRPPGVSPWGVDVSGLLGGKIVRACLVRGEIEFFSGEAPRFSSDFHQNPQKFKTVASAT